MLKGEIEITLEILQPIGELNLYHMIMGQSLNIDWKGANHNINGMFFDLTPKTFCNLSKNLIYILDWSLSREAA